MNKKPKPISKEILYWKVTDLWKRFCEEHTALLDKTSEEYTYLLSSDLDKLENCIEEKNQTLNAIHHLEEIRQELIKELNQILGEEKVKSVSDLIKTMNEFEIEKKQKHLFRFNALLIDLIEKIQSQNKKNQLFINKALHSLKSIREEALGTKSYSSYNSKGASTRVGI